MNIVERTYQITALFPKDERFGLISQMRRCAVSIASNISEGSGRNSNREFNYFLGISNGSANELFTQLILSERLNFIDKKIVEPIIKEVIEVQKINYTLIKKFSKKK